MTLFHALDVVLLLTAVPSVLAAGYLLLLACSSRRAPCTDHGQPCLRFQVVVPAHNEESGIAETVRSVRQLDYPEELRRILVVADNCSDATAARAARAGAAVLERVDAVRRGKGYALAHAFHRCLADQWADAVVVVDADSVVSPNLLRAFAARLGQGADAVQAHYGVRNPDASWRTRLLAIAFALFHGVRSLGRERLRCSAGLRGNGMCFTTALVRAVPHEAFSVVEDVEYGIRLGLASRRVHYAEEALVLGDMAVSAEASRTQRTRWEGGRMQIARLHAPTLLRRFVRRPNRILLDLAFDVLVPPLSYVVAFTLAGAVASIAASSAADQVLLATYVWGCSLLALAVYIVRGWWLSGTGLKGLQAFVYAPLYVAWKVGLALSQAGQPPGDWVRTARERRSQS